MIKKTDLVPGNVITCAETMIHYVRKPDIGPVREVTNIIFPWIIISAQKTTIRSKSWSCTLMELGGKQRLATNTLLHNSYFWMWKRLHL